MTSVSQEIASMQKAIERLQGKCEDLAKDYELSAKELSEAKFQQALADRNIENVKRDRDEKKKLELVLGADVKDEIQRKSDQEQERRELQIKIMDVNAQISQWEIKQRALGDEHKRDKLEVEEQKRLLSAEQKAKQNEFEANKAILRNEMLDAQNEVEKNFAAKLEAHRVRYSVQLNEFRKEERQKVHSETLHYQQQLEKADKENKEFTNKVKDANDILSLLKSNIALLKRDIRREILNDEVIGTSKIAELKKVCQDAISFQEKKDCALLEKRIASQKLKINDTAAEIALVREQVSVLEQKIQQVQLDKTIKEIAYSQMEQSKLEMEDRLTEQIEALDAKIHRSDHNQAEYDKEIEKLEEILSFITREAEDLRDKVLDLTAEYKKQQKIQQALADDLTKLLGEERLKIMKMEKDKRSVENSYANLDKKHTALLDKESNLNIQLKNYQKSYKQNSEATERAQGKNQKLEQAVRKLESRASK